MEDYGLNWQVLLIIIFLVSLVAGIIRSVYKVFTGFNSIFESFRESVRELKTSVEMFKRSCEWIQGQNVEEHE